MPKKTKIKPSFGMVLEEFATWGTVAGLVRIATTTSYLRGIYSVIVAGLFAAFIAAISISIAQYLEYPSTTELAITVESQPFPTFTFCNENPLKKHVVDTLPQFAEIATMLQQFEDLSQGIRTADDYNLSTTTDSLERWRRARTILRLMMNKLSPSDRIQAGYNFSEIVSECTFAGEACTSADFSHFLHPEYGRCYTLKGDRMVTRAGRAKGLRMLFTVNQDTPLVGTFDYLPTTDSASVWTAIHSAEEQPDFSVNGLRFGAGRQTFLALTKASHRTHSRLAKPHGSCTNDSASFRDYYSNTTYTQSLCQHACLQRLAADTCHCVDPLYPKLANQTWCTSSADAICLIGFTASVSAPNSESGAKLCPECTIHCTDVVYRKTISRGIFPAKNYLVSAGSQKQRDRLLNEQGGGRGGQGDDEWDDYEENHHSSTTTSRTTSTATVTPALTPTFTPTLTPTLTPSSTAPATTTSDMETCKYGGPPKSDANEIKYTSYCEKQWSTIYNDKNLIVIRGHPCVSKNICNSCIMFSNTTIDKFICNHHYSNACTEKTNSGYLNMMCSDFFTKFDFIPHGSQIPNIAEWWLGAGPDDTDPSGCKTLPQPDQENCWRTSVCQSNMTSSDLTAPKEYPIPFHHDFLTSLKPWTSPCELAKLALAAAEKHYGPVGGRKKRETIAFSTVDVPGFGSCEYANKNFRGRQHCIDWYKMNGLLVHVYFESLQVESYTQIPTYPIPHF